MGNQAIEGDVRIEVLNPDLLFVQNMVSRPRFTPYELEIAIAATNRIKVAIEALEILNERRPFLSPRELILMRRRGITPAGVRGVMSKIRRPRR